MRRRKQTEGLRASDAYPELWRLVKREPAQSEPWRRYWLLWIPAFTVIALGCIVGGVDLFSLAGLAVLAAALIVIFAVNAVLPRPRADENPEP
jgi:Flp pilus assembly protein TadB